MKKNIFISCIVFIIGIFLILIGYILIQNEKITISFITNDESVLKSIEIKKGERVNLPILIRDDYSFLGWYDGDIKVDNNFQFFKSTSLNAKWSKKQYTISFDSNGGTNIESQKVNDGGNVLKPVNPIKQGYTFSHWELNGKEYDFSLVVSENITLKAVWKQDNEVFTVNFYHSQQPLCNCVNCACNSYTPILTIKVKNGEKISAPQNPEPYPYFKDTVFSGWYIIKSGIQNKIIFDFDTPITENINLYAFFTDANAQ